MVKSDKIVVKDKLSLFEDHWNPRIVGELNDQHVKLVKFSGEFVWHKHDHEDEMFYVIKGNFKMEFRDKIVNLNEEEFIIVPKGIEHRPVAKEEVHVMLFEPATTLNTGDRESSKFTSSMPSFSAARVHSLRAASADRFIRLPVWANESRCQFRNSITRR